MSKEQRLITAIKTVEATVKQNSNCRKKRKLISCQQCDLLKSCNMHDYQKKLERKNALALVVPRAWEIEKKIRGI
jgi:hypothetical protein